MSEDLHSDRSDVLLRQISLEDVNGLIKAARSYGDSWCRRGGIGAFMMLARKWDRIEQQVSRPTMDLRDGRGHVPQFDIFRHIETDPRPEGLIDDIRDLRRYLMLVEEYMRRQKADSALSAHRDNEEDDRPAMERDPLERDFRLFLLGVRWREGHVQAGGAEASLAHIQQGFSQLTNAGTEGVPADHD